MTKEEFMKGITILYAFGLKQKDDWELEVWYRALSGEMTSEQYEKACIHLARNNMKFWETDNVPAQLMDVVAEFKQERATKLIAQRSEADQQRRQRERQEAIDSYESEEDRIQCVEQFKKMNRETFKGVPG